MTTYDKKHLDPNNWWEYDQYDGTDLVVVSIITFAITLAVFACIHFMIDDEISLEEHEAIIKIMEMQVDRPTPLKAPLENPQQKGEE